MENTKEVKEFYESIILERAKALIEKIESEGFSDDTYTFCCFLEDDLAKLNAAQHFFDAHHQEGRQKQKIGA